MEKFTKEDNMFYAIYDNQLDQVRGFGLNYQDLNLVRKEMVKYLLIGNFSLEGENSIRENTLEELCNYYEFTLIKSTNKIPDDYQL